MSWRDHIPVHPEAAKMRPLTKVEYDLLRRSIEKHGLLVPVVLVRQDGLDQMGEGCNRLDIMEQVGRPVIDEHGKLIAKHITIDADADPSFSVRDYVRAVNDARRHKTQKELRQSLEEEIAEHPELSDNEIAKRAGVSNHTVAAARPSNWQSANKDRREASGRKARGRKPGSNPAPVALTPPRTAGADTNAAALRNHTGRQTAVVEALMTLQGATEKSLSATPVDPADIAAQWHDSAVLASIIDWLRRLLEFVAVRQGV
jgi:hypothetical protein